MEIDASFNWQLADRIEGSSPGQDTRKQDQDDYEITQRRPILRFVDAPAPRPEEDMEFDPYNSGNTRT